ncbi:MAG TPA: F0F1 ATP synthase subunit alpha, partial [bacterium]|nr:F0F1 ATP synthase subunit alpha [bacterium]
IIFAGGKGLLDDLPVEDVRPFEEKLCAFLDEKYPEVGHRIQEDKVLSDETRAQLSKALDEYKQQFLASKKS